MEMLQEHHATGRLDAIEFNDRMEKVLRARFQGEIDGLFNDLPDPRPNPPTTPYSQPAPLPSVTQPSMYGEVAASSERHEDPWYAQWWMILVAVGITVISRGNAGPLVLMMAIWLWVIYPSLSSTKRRRSLGSQPYQHGPYEPPAFARRLSTEQRRAITARLDAGQQIAAIKLYREFTGAGLKDAKDAIDSWQRQLGD